MEDLETRYKKLPEEMKRIIFAPETAEAVGRSGETAGLSEEQTEMLLEEVGRVLFGYLTPSELVRSLPQKLNIDPAKTAALQAELERNLFKNIRPALEKLSAPLQAPVASPEASNDPYREVPEVKQAPQVSPVNHRNFSGTPYQGRPGASQTPARPPLAPLPSYQKEPPVSPPTQTPPERTRDPYREPPL